MTMLRMSMSSARISIFTIRDIIMILFLIATLGVLGDDAHVSHMRYTKEKHQRRVVTTVKASMSRKATPSSVLLLQEMLPRLVLLSSSVKLREVRDYSG